MRKDFDQAWRALSDEVLTGMKEWRLHAAERQSASDVERDRSGAG